VTSASHRCPPWASSVFADRSRAQDFTPEERDAVDLARTVSDELLGADAFLFAVPLYNFGVSQHVKAWIDLVITDPRVGQNLQGRPAVLVVARGGAYGEGTPREGWDHAVGWLRRIFHDVWGLDLRVVEAEFTLVGVNPALDQFTDVAAEMRATAERGAAGYGRHLSGALTH
jgi:FMN-dependent NADH-azoreductase